MARLLEPGPQPKEMNCCSLVLICIPVLGGGLLHCQAKDLKALMLYIQKGVFVKDSPCIQDGNLMKGCI